MKKLTRGFSDLSDFFFPKLCVTCGDRLLTVEKFLCMDCWSDLPVTNFHFSPENKVAQLFWGRVEITHATAFFSYKKGSRYQQLIHFIKYKGLKELGLETGRRYGFELLNSLDFACVDCIVPVPLHPKKEKKRGFNQSTWIAKGIAEALQKPFSEDNLFRKVDTSTQTKKNRFERWQNVERIFDLRNPPDFSGKHILLVDDVVTTGSTLEACAFQLLELKNTKVSLATLAFADY